MATNTGQCTTRFLSELTQDYERSRVFLAQLEESLSKAAPTAASPVPALSSARAESLEQDLDVIGVDSPIFKPSLSHLFTHKALNLTNCPAGDKGRLSESGMPAPQRGPAVVNFCSKQLNGILTKAPPRRAVSFYQKRSPALLPSPVSNRQPSQEPRQWEQQLEDMKFRRWISTSDAGAFSPTLRRKKSQPFAFQNARRASGPNPAQPSISSSGSGSPGIVAQPSHSLSQSGSFGASSVPRSALVPPALETALFPFREHSTRNRRTSRLSSGLPTSAGGASQQQQQSDSPSSPSSPFSPSSPLITAAAGLPDVRRPSNSRLAPSRGSSNVSARGAVVQRWPSTPPQLLVGNDDADSGNIISDTDSDTYVGADSDDEAPPPLMPLFKSHYSACVDAVIEPAHALNGAGTTLRQHATTSAPIAIGATPDGLVGLPRMGMGSPIGSSVLISFPTSQQRARSFQFAKPDSPTCGRPPGGGLFPQRGQFQAPARAPGGAGGGLGGGEGAAAPAMRRVWRGSSVEFLPYVPEHEQRRAGALIRSSPHADTILE